MSDQNLFLLASSFICSAAFLVGLRFRRMTKSPRPEQDLSDVHRFGLLMMVAAPALYVFTTVGVLGGWMKVGV